MLFQSFVAVAALIAAANSPHAQTTIMSGTTYTYETSTGVPAAMGTIPFSGAPGRA